jgi:hypothetical protein
MAAPDYEARNKTNKDLILSLDGAVLTILLNRAEQYVYVFVLDNRCR